MTPGPRKRRDRAHRADGLPAAGVTLERDPHADDGRLDGGELARETGNVLGRNAGHLLDIVGRELRGAGGKLGEAHRVLLHPILVDMATSDQRSDDAHGERAVSAGFRHDVPVGMLCRA